MKYLLLDVAGTILFKPQLYTRIYNVLKNNNYNVSLDKLKYNHKILTEIIKFPDRTDSNFYLYFNSELLYSLGIVPNDFLLESIFNECSYLSWEKYDDVDVLDKLQIPIGILSNFNSSLKHKLSKEFGCIFSNIFVSEELGLAKPSLGFYNSALKEININPKEILYIGDSFKLDYYPASTLGLNAYVIDRDNFYGDSLKTISSLNQILDLV